MLCKPDRLADGWWVHDDVVGHAWAQERRSVEGKGKGMLPMD